MPPQASAPCAAPAACMLGSSKDALRLPSRGPTGSSWGLR